MSLPQPGTSAFSAQRLRDHSFDKVAALLRSVGKNHPLIDGKKRLGWLTTSVFLELNRVSVLQVSNNAAYALVMEIAAGSHDVEQISDALVRMVAKP